MDRALKVETATQVTSAEVRAKIERVLETYFLEKFLPRAGFFKRDEEEAKIYVSKRSDPQRRRAELVIRSQLTFAGFDDDSLSDDHYERGLDAIFWGHNYGQYIYIVGDPGCGKSTFLDYYLRCYCPSVHIPPREFAKKLILQLDMAEINSKSEFESSFYEQSRERIIREFDNKNMDIEEAHEYFFWDGLLKWDHPDTRDWKQGSQLSERAFRKMASSIHAGQILDKYWVGIRGIFSLVNAVRFYFATSSFGAVTEWKARSDKIAQIRQLAPFLTACAAII